MGIIEIPRPRRDEVDDSLGDNVFGVARILTFERQ
jgi:hypothetical protein